MKLASKAQTNPRDIDPEECSDVRAITYQSHVYIQRIKEKKIEFREKLLF